MAARLPPAAFAEAAAALLGGVAGAVLAALLILLLTPKRTADDEALVPPAPPPDGPGLVPPAASPTAPGEGGFTGTPAPAKPGEGTTPSPALPHGEEGPAPAPAMPTVAPKLTPEEKAKQEDKLRSLDLPTEGRHRFVPPKNWRAHNELPRGPRKGYMDAYGNEWVKPRGKKVGDDWHWDVQLPNGRHRNVMKNGQTHH